MDVLFSTNVNHNVDDVMVLKYCKTRWLTLWKMCYKAFLAVQRKYFTFFAKVLCASYHFLPSSHAQYSYIVL